MPGELIPRVLPRTSLLVGPVALGTVKIGRTSGLKYPSAQQLPVLPTDEDVLSLLREAAALGVNLIDTAPAYGVSEERLGALLPRVRCERGWVVSTKVGEEWDGASSRYDFSPAHLRASMERSCARLRVDTLDAVLLHMSASVDDVDVLTRDEVIDELRAAQRRGLVRVVGASTSTLEGALLAVARCDVVMLKLSARERADLPARAWACSSKSRSLLATPIRRRCTPSCTRPG